MDVRNRFLGVICLHIVDREYDVLISDRARSFVQPYVPELESLVFRDFGVRSKYDVEVRRANVKHPVREAVVDRKNALRGPPDSSRERD